MQPSIIRRAFAAALTLLAVGSAVAFSSTRGSPSDYAFELVDREVRQGRGATVTVRLFDLRTGKIVPDATLFISRLEGSPHDMGEMSASLDPAPDTLPGYYRFKTNLLREGGWALTLAAKAPVVSGAIQSRLVLQAVP